MDLDDYLLVQRRAALTLRTVMDDPRLSFEEMGLLCHLGLSERPQRLTDLAAFEGVIRPTMSHRLQRLAKLGFVERSRGETDRRTVHYAITNRGRWQVEDFLEATAQSIDAPDPLATVSPERLGRYVEAAATVRASASDLILLALHGEGRALRVTELQRRCGLLQPTCSIALASLESRGLVERGQLEGADVMGGAPTRSRPAELSAMGVEMARRIAERVADVVVHR